MSIYARDGSLRVTLVPDGQPVTQSDSGPGVYAADGSIRVTVVGGGVPEGDVVVSQDEPITIRTFAGLGGVVGTVEIVNGVAEAFLPAFTGYRVNGGNMDVQNSSGSVEVTGTTVVSEQGSIQHVSLPSSVALVADQEALVVPVTGTYVDTATFTVVNGAITGIVLS